MGERRLAAYLHGASPPFPLMFTDATSFLQGFSFGGVAGKFRISISFLQLTT